MPEDNLAAMLSLCAEEEEEEESFEQLFSKFKLMKGKEPILMELKGLRRASLSQIDVMFFTKWRVKYVHTCPEMY